MIITVVGLGVVGGSFVKALKGQGHEVYGVDVDEETLARAKADGCIKEGFVDGREIIKKSDMTIICLYPSLVLDYIKNHEFKKGSIITDAVGVKTHFLNEAMDLLKDKDVEFVSTDVYQWLLEHSYEYGYVLRYPSDKVTITQKESCNIFRYVGKENAQKMYNQNLCLEELNNQ